ncbi:MAG: stage II sporulation protein M [Bacteroidota bacterium]
MREALFIKKNAEKWQEHQHLPTDDPDEQAERFITILDDLAYAKTFYPQSKVTKWINGIAAGTYQKIYQNKKEKYSRLGTFWKTELPMVMYNHRKVLYFTFGLFMLFVGLAVWSSTQDYKFVSGFLSDGYVEMTEENINKGDPFGVYRDGDKFSMFGTIMLNNMLVFFLQYTSGIVFGLGSLYWVFKDGLLIGTFQSMFFFKGLGWKSVMVIWMHGSIEISCMVLSGVAGFILAKGMMFPGTYSRKESFKIHAKDSIKLMLGLMPLIVLAAFIESYITYLMSNAFDNTNNASIPVWLGAILLIGMLGSIIWYFAIYPYKVAKKQAAFEPDPVPQLMTA